MLPAGRGRLVFGHPVREGLAHRVGVGDAPVPRGRQERQPQLILDPPRAAVACRHKTPSRRYSGPRGC